jgi:hypothetical protein
MGVRMGLLRVFARRVRRMRIVLVRMAGFVTVLVVAGRNHIHFCAGQAAAHHLALVQVSAHAELGTGFLKDGTGDAGVNQSAQQHVAAYAGKTFKISNTHRM